MKPELKQSFSKFNFSNWQLILTIVVLVSIALSPSLYNGWVNWDDPAYVLRNGLVQNFSQGGVSEMFTTAEQVGLYHPITLISLSFDYYLWGSNPFGFHLTSFLLHLANSALVFTFLRKIKLSPIVAFSGALLFGMHPMHVESVAWISARKDVLYAFFFLVSLISYLTYQRSRNKWKFLWYLIALVVFAISLLSKSLALTLPLLLLLIDYLIGRKFSLSLLMDKIPYFVLAVLALVVAKHSQEVSDSMVSTLPLNESIFVSSYNVIAYMVKAIAPLNLSAFHPYPPGFGPTAIFYASIIPVLALIYFLFRWFRTRKFLFFGAMFYLITVAPVSQMIPFGKAISSERYTYIPYIGLFIIISLGIRKLLEVRPSGKWKFATLGIVGLWFLFLGIQTYNQSKIWKGSEQLWSSVIREYPESEWAYMSRAMHRFEIDDISGAEDDFNTSISIQPFAQSHYERGYLFEAKWDFRRAVDDYKQSIALDPHYAKSHLNLGILLVKFNDTEGAIYHIKKATSYDSNYSLAHFNLGILYKLRGDFSASYKSYSRAITLEPNNGLYLRHRGVLSNQRGNYSSAIKDFERAMLYEPNSGEAYYLRSVSYLNLGFKGKAIDDAKKATRMGIQLPEGYIQSINSQ
ncbi:MAG: tetratricopeptide repeat protein [Crocinitomicaceae bacterium]|nr:tetratricopeptide repeat protein [Crocinitomicaceae bacterium]